MSEKRLVLTRHLEDGSVLTAELLDDFPSAGTLREMNDWIADGPRTLASILYLDEFNAAFKRSVAQLTALTDAGASV